MLVFYGHFCIQTMKNITCDLYLAGWSAALIVFDLVTGIVDVACGVLCCLTGRLLGFDLSVTV